MGRGRAKEGRSHAIMLHGACQIVLQRGLAYTDVLVVYEHLCVFPELWL